jgi:hypothetical protein
MEVQKERLDRQVKSFYFIFLLELRLYFIYLLGLDFLYLFIFSLLGLDLLLLLE